MSIRVRPESPVPIYEQIVSQVVFAVAGGDLAPGDLVPSVRELAADLVINPNTVSRAFQELERLGVVEARRGRGMAVTAEAPKRCRDRRKESVRDRIRDAVREAVAAGLSAEDVRKLVETEWPVHKNGVLK
ncbi:MAG TPA: GntR family transcriptional regulator [Fimbriiglobus sp.]|jgi:GntR family transcriptional regulator